MTELHLFLSPCSEKRILNFDTDLIDLCVTEIVGKLFQNSIIFFWAFNVV